MSSPRVNAASVYFNGSLWVTGGQSNAGILDTTEWYIFAQDKWIQGPTLPMKLVKHSMAVVGNSSVVLITGGLQAVSDNYLNDPSMSELTKTILLIPIKPNYFLRSDVLHHHFYLPELCKKVVGTFVLQNHKMNGVPIETLQNVCYMAWQHRNIVILS